MNGPEKLVLFKNLNAKDLLPEFQDSEKLQKLWDDFLLLYMDLRKTFENNSEIENFSKRITQSTVDFLYLYENNNVTPYMHAFCCRVPEFLGMYGNIAFFNQQGLEKYNDQASKDYFRSTNHKGMEALHQLLIKKHRVHYLEMKGAERVKACYHCRNCLNTGHSIKKCTNKCSDCDTKICCTHLVKINGAWEKVQATMKF